MKVLVINCGSSSLKYQLIDAQTEKALAVGLCERIGIDGRLNHTPAGGEKVVINKDMPDHEVAVQMVLDELTDEKYGVISDLKEIDAIGHRVVHGGEKFASSVVITQLYLDHIIGAGAMMAGLLVNAGVGLLILFRLNRDRVQNLKIVGVLYGLGVFWGIIIEFAGIVF